MHTSIPLEIRLKVQRKLAKVRGVFSSPIPYEVRVPSGDSSPFFGNYYGQKYGPWDTDTCWDFGLCDNIETQLEIERSLGRFTQDDLTWFKANEYIDSDGDFNLSRRFIAILSGVRDKGNDPAIAWKLAEQYGMIPFSMLSFAIQDINGIDDRQGFVDKYFDVKSITPAMEAMGKEFLKRVSIQSEELGTRWTTRTSQMVTDALKQAPVQIGIPVPQDGSWNQIQVKWNGRKIVDHSVDLYRYFSDSAYPYYIYDSYEPHLKELSSDYYIPVMIRGIVTANNLSPILTVSVWNSS